MTTEAGVVTVRVVADVSELDRSLARTEAEVQAFDRKLGGVSKSIEKGLVDATGAAAAGVTALSTAITVAGGYAASNLLKRNTEIARSFFTWTDTAAAASEQTLALANNTKLLTYTTKLLEGPKNAAGPDFKPYDGAAASLGELIEVAPKASKATGEVAESMGRTALMSRGMALGLTAVVAGFALYGAKALHDVVETNDKISLSLMGVGRLSGATVQTIREVAEASSTWTGLTVGAARDVASALAHAGVASENLAPATKTIKSFALVMGTDVPEATQAMARGLSSGAQGMTQLLQSVGALNYENKTLIESLVASGQAAQAQTVTIAGVARATEGATEHVGFFSKAWNATKNVFSSVGESIDNTLSRITGVGQTTEQQIATLTQMRDNILNGRPIELVKGGQRSVLDEVLRRLDLLIAKQQTLNSLSDEARNNQSLLLGGMATEQAVPEVAAVRDLENRLSALKTGAQAYRDTATEAFDPATVNNYNLAIDRTVSQLSVAKMGLLGFASLLKDVQAKQIVARTPDQRASAAAAAAELRYIKQGASATEAKALAQKDYSNSLLQTRVQLQQQSEMQLLQANQETQLLQVQLGVIGKTGAEQQRQIALATTRFQLEQEALRVYGNSSAIDQKKLEALTQQINKQAELNRLLAAARLSDDLLFQFQQLGRDDVTSRVAEKLRAAGLDVNKEMYSLLGQQAAAVEKFTELKSSATDFLGGFAKDMLAGKSATEALGNALNRLASRLIDMATNQLISGLFSSLLGGLFPGAGSVIPAITNAGLGSTTLGRGRYHAGGLVGSTPPRITRLHSGGDLASDEVFAILQKGERVIPRNQNSQSGEKPIIINNTFNNVDPSMRAFIAQNNAILAKQIRSATPGDVGKYKADNPGYLAGVTL